MPLTFSEPFLPRHPWLAAFLLGTVATPAGVVIGWLAPRPLDLVFAPPLVLLDIMIGSGAPATARVSALLLGILLTWASYVLLARLALWRLVREGPDANSADDSPDGEQQWRE